MTAQVAVAVVVVCFLLFEILLSVNATVVIAVVIIFGYNSYSLVVISVVFLDLHINLKNKLLSFFYIVFSFNLFLSFVLVLCHVSSFQTYWRSLVGRR